MSRPLLFSVVGVILANFGPRLEGSPSLCSDDDEELWPGEECQWRTGSNGELQYTVEALEKHIGVLSVILS